jgi:hypothetical protein
MRRIIALATAGVLLLVLVLAQLLLPGIAAQVIRDRLDDHGKVISVEVSAFPAIKLLWHRADSVVIRMATYRSTTSDLGSQLAQAGDVGSLDASVTRLDTGLLTLHDATLTKRGDQLIGSAHVTESDLTAAVPFLQSVQPVTSGEGQLTLRGTATLLGVSASVDVTVSARNGAVVVQPDVPLGGLATVTVFSNPHLEVQSVSATKTPDGFTVTATARLK